MYENLPNRQKSFFRQKTLSRRETFSSLLSRSTLLSTAILLSGLMSFGIAEAKTEAKTASSVTFQNVRVTGTVLVEGTNEALSGANIIEKGTNNGTSTDAAGRFALQIRSNQATLIISSVGYETQEIQVAGRQELQIKLQPLTQQVEEVVVTALGLQREKRSLGYSVGTVSGESLNQVAQESVLGGLSGKIPGVTLNETSGTGSSISMVIRGANSLTTDNQPLFVVDGVPMSNSMNNQRQMGSDNIADYGNRISDINPNDIESISVLKGPSAAALYGSRAGNGVVLITTKSAKAGSPTRVDVSSSNVFETPVHFLDFHYMYANGERTSKFDEGSAYWTGLPLDRGIEAVQWNAPLDASGRPIATELVSYKDNMKNFLETGMTSTNNIGLSGSGPKSTYRVSYNNMSHNGLIPNSDLFRNALSSVLSFELSPKLTFSSHINLNRTHSNSRPSTATRRANPLEAVMAYPHVNVLELQDYWVEGQEHVQQMRPNTLVDNPYFLAYELTNAFARNRAYGNLRLDWDILPGLSAFARFAGDISSENRETKVPKSFGRAANGGYYIQNMGNHEVNTDILVSYHKAIQNIDFNVSVGGNYMYQYGAGTAMNGSALTIPGLYRISNVPTTNISYSNSISEQAIYSAYALASIGLYNQLYIDLTARNDWASSLPAVHQSFFYPSASLSWLANETFQLPRQISLLKLRAGWAQVGNAPGPYQIDPVLGTGQYGNLITMSVPGNVRNPLLKPEIATSTEVGLDFNLFQNRIRFEGTYYQVGNSNQQLSIPAPESSGASSLLVNAGLIESTGWEFGLGGTPIRNANWVWDINANFSTNEAVLKELVDGVTRLDLWNSDSRGYSFAMVGDKIGNLYSAGYARVMDENSPYYRWPILNNEGEWQRLNSADDYMHVGNYNPDFQVGLQTSLQYKKFTLSASFDWRQGGQFMSFTYRYGGSDWRSGKQMRELIPGGLMDPAALAEMLRSDPERYIIPSNGHFPRVGGYEQETGGFYYASGSESGYDGIFIPGVISDGQGGYIEHLGGDGTNIKAVSDQYPWDYYQNVTFDASFIKLREISLGYDLPSIRGIQNARISVFSRNIMLWTAAKIGIDPERAFQASSGTQGHTSTLYKQGAELQNIMPMTMPFGFKLDFTF